MTTDTKRVDDELGTGIFVDYDRVHRTGIHTPRLIALEARIGRVTGFFIEDIDVNQTA